MEKKYFLQENGKVSQPYSLDDLRSKNLTEDTLVCEKFGNWKPAKDIPELAELIEWQPPLPSESDWVPPSPQIQSPSLPQKHQSGNKALIIAFGAILVAAFFMPWISAFVSLSAWDMVFGDAGKMIGSSFRFVVVCIPIVGILIIYGAAFNNENYPISKSLLFILPGLILVMIGIVISSKLGLGEGMSSNGSGEILKIFGIGFWLTLICSIILPFLGQATAKATTLLGGDAETRLAESRVITEISTTANNPDSQPQQPSRQPEEQLTQEQVLPEPPSQTNFPQLETILLETAHPSDEEEELKPGLTASKNFTSRYKMPLIIGAILVVVGCASYLIIGFNSCNKEGEKFLGTWTKIKNGEFKYVDITKKLLSCVYKIEYSTFNPETRTNIKTGSAPLEATYKDGVLKIGESVAITFSNGKIIYSGEEYEKVNFAAEGTQAFVQTMQGSTLRLRAAPSDQAAIVSNIPNEAALTILRYNDHSDIEKGKWCQVNYNGTVGWAWGGFLKVGEKDGQPTMDNSRKLTQAEAKKLIGKQMVIDGIIEQSCLDQANEDGFEKGFDVNAISLGDLGQQFSVEAVAGYCGEISNSPCAYYWVYEYRNDNIKLILSVECFKGSVNVLKTRSNGYLDIESVSYIGAYGDVYKHRYRYNGKEYK